ncbi:unnamed protein product [Haemonchus placei]|uniref:COesterase domain-containing protein n=1 Tax=Haemonchus placei TaxID=6290 RepID=A0A0N4X7A6_HAEPC|nr:unnamed protein product [Haemonchus placei]
MFAYFVITALLCSTVIPSVQAQIPKLVLEEPPILLGSIHGSPIVSVFHGPSDLIKDDFQSKDTEDDPLYGKMGPIKN